MNIKSEYIFPAINNLCKPISNLSRLAGLNNKILYVAEKGWSLRHDAESIRSKLNIKIKNRFKISSYPISIRSDIFHFASNFQWVEWQKSLPINKIYICNYYHGKRSDSKSMDLFVDQFLESEPKLSKIVVSNSIVKNRLINEYKINEKKLTLIPIGVNVENFKPQNLENNFNIKNKYGIPQGDILLGSFQKDGVGRKGEIPKKIKGPDIFVEVVKKISQNFPITVLLSGPSRQYIKNRLEDLGINYFHFLFSHPDELLEFYRIIDLYLVTSREEGGPKALIESLSCGKNVVSTPVGMSTDLNQLDFQNFSVSKTFDPEEISSLCSNLLSKKLDKSSIYESHYKIKKYCSWQEVASQYQNKLYM